MLRYLKAAFFERVRVPPLGDVPANLIAAGTVGILGFGHPAFWLLGVGLETAYLAMLATNRRYQRVVDARSQWSDPASPDRQHETMVERLTPPDLARLRALENKCDRASELAKTHRQDETLIDSNREALATLIDLYLRLLLARQLLQTPDAGENEARIRRQMDELRRDLARPDLAPSLKESKTATLEILQRRLQNFGRREQSLAEIESDLARIEAQVDLAVENAAVTGEPQAVSSNIKLVSQWLDPDLRGLNVSGDTGSLAEPLRESAT